MLKSRAVPEDFDMAKALHWPYANYSKMASAGPFVSHNQMPEQKQPQVVVESVKFTGDEYATAQFTNSTGYGYYASTPISVTASTCSDNTPHLHSPNGAESSATTWRYTQIPTPPLESAGVSEAGSFSEPKSPILNRQWGSLFSEENAAASSSSKFAPSLQGRLHTPVTPLMNYSDRGVASPLSSIDLTERPGMLGFANIVRLFDKHCPNQIELGLVSQQDKRRLTSGSLPTSLPSLSSSDQPFHQPASCLGLSSFGITNTQGTSSTMGFTNSGLVFDLGSRFGGVPYPVDAGRNIWEIES